MSYSEIQLTIDVRHDLVEYIWNDIDRLIELGFKFPALNTWQKSEISKIEKSNANYKTSGIPINEEYKSYSNNEWEIRYRQAQVYSYFNVREKIPEDKRRKVIFSSKFSCPSEHELGLKNLIACIENGKNLLPFMSRQIVKPTAQDGLLFDFGITHMHLGIGPDPMRPALIAGTEEVVYCVFDIDNAYFLITAEHGLWAEIALLELVQKEFEHLLVRWEIAGILGLERSLTPQERIDLRKAGANSLIEVGGRFYASPGGGINTAGTSMFSVMKVHHMLEHYRDIEAQLRSIIRENSQKIQEENGFAIPELNLQMIDPDRYIFADKNRSLKLQATVNPETLEMLSIRSL